MAAQVHVLAAVKRIPYGVNGALRVFVAKGEGRSQPQSAVFKEEPVSEVTVSDQELLGLQHLVKGVQDDGKEGAAATDFSDRRMLRKAAAEVVFEGGGAEREALPLQQVPSSQASRTAYGMPSEGGEVTKHGVFSQGCH